MSRLQPYGYNIRPLDQGEMEFRAEAEKARSGAMDQYDIFMKQREQFIDSRPDVILTEHLVFIDKRPSNSNAFETTQRIDSRIIMNRPAILGAARQDFGVSMAVDPRPVCTQYINDEFNREQIQRVRKVI